MATNDHPFYLHKFEELWHCCCGRWSFFLLLLLSPQEELRADAPAQPAGSDQRRQDLDPRGLALRATLLDERLKEEGEVTADLALVVILPFQTAHVEVFVQAADKDGHHAEQPGRNGGAYTG